VAAVLGAILALTLKLGKRGTRDEILHSGLSKKAEMQERQQREKQAAEPRSEFEGSKSPTGTLVTS